MTKILVMSTETEYNITHKSVYAEPVLIGRIVCNAKRYKKYPNFRRRTQFNPLWWNLPNSLILQKTETELAFAKSNSIPSRIQTLSPRRINLSHYLCLDCWYSPFEQDQNSSRQWRLPTNNWLKNISIFKQFETFFKTSRPKSHSEYQQRSRSSKVKDVLSAQTSHQPSIRFRLIRSYHLRQAYRRCRKRLQPWQKRCPFLSSLTVLRISLKRLLAWGLKARKCLHFRWVIGISKRMPCQTSSIYLSHQSPSRFWFFRSQIYRASRRQRDWLCHCRQVDPYYPTETQWVALSQIQKRLGSRRFPLRAQGLEEATPHCNNTPPKTRKRFRTTNPFHFKTLLLSSLRNQSSFGSRKCLVFLSWPCLHRSNYQRAQRELRLGENTNQQLSGQSGLLFSSPFCLQYRQLVQANLFAQKISTCVSRNYSKRHISSTSKISQIRKQEYTQAAKGIYSQAGVGIYYAQN